MPKREIIEATQPVADVAIVYIGDGTRYVPDYPTEGVLMVSEADANRLTDTGLYEVTKGEQPTKESDNNGNAA